MALQFYFACECFSCSATVHQLYKLYYMADTDTKFINSSHLYTDQKHVSQKLMLQYLHFSSPSPLAVFHSIHAHESV